MKITKLDIGDVVYAANDITDDGSMPDHSEGELLALAGARGIIVMKGLIEEAPQRQVFLVRFEDATLTLGGGFVFRRKINPNRLSRTNQKTILLARNEHEITSSNVGKGFGGSIDRCRRQGRFLLLGNC
ncbi:nitrogen fixation protein NifZ [Methylotuvimicrobium alcaliphilum]|uniref:Uncharacterized protein n=1 Tax=Methylotuvimicrobium alcaliphilum (strain DSM 19304 / NCIMB 14124 / VKM B-2133 / 20Z) TaxID=1091494 RepID=G4SUZ4_META2|nr:nitrogen fixation protein NifZ [Methylotuvimicrobium alcaliphilum]CCE24053.1 protein of unknown function [Methylotuvimicrobium alcaliphilum 20Z]